MFQGTGALAFNATFYLQNNPDVFQAIQNGTFQGSALDHFVQFGQFEGRDPNQFFDTEYYLANNTDVLVAIADPANPSVVSAFQHFVDFGSEEGVVRAPSAAFASFNAQTYLTQNPDLQEAFGNLTGEALEDRLFQHFVEFGVNENRPGSGVTIDGGLPGQTFNLTTGIDTLVGTANNDTFVANIGSGSFDVPANTLNTGDSINGGAGVDTLNAVVAPLPGLFGNGSLTAAPTLTSIENVNVQFTDPTESGELFTLNLKNASGVETLAVNNSSAVGTITNVGSIANLAVTNSQSAVTFGGSTATALNLTVSNVATQDDAGEEAGVAIDIASTKLTSLDLTVSNSFVNLTGTTAALAALTVSAVGGENTVDLASSGAVKSVTVDGSGSLELTTAFGAALTSFNAADNTGGVEATFGGVSNVTVTGGAGDDVFNFGGTLTVKDTVNGGEGFDTVVVVGGDYSTADAAAAFNALTSIERVEFDGDAATTLDGATFTNAGITNLLFNNAGGAVINAAGTARTYEFGEDFSGDATFNMKAGATVLNVDLLGGESVSDADGIVTSGAVAIGTLDVNLAAPAAGAADTAVSTINLDSVGSLAEGEANTIELITARGGSTVVITGDANLDIGGFEAEAPFATAGFTINASAFEADLTFRGSVGADTITLGGSGQTVIEFLGGDSGVATETANPTIIGFDIVTGFNAGEGGDILSFIGAEGAEFEAVSAATQASINQSVTLLDAFQLAAGQLEGAGWTAFTFGTNTYAAYSDGDDSFTGGADGGDVIVQLNGVNVADLDGTNFGPTVIS